MSPRTAITTCALGLALTACGRVGFDPYAGDASVDARGDSEARDSATGDADAHRMDASTDSAFDADTVDTGDGDGGSDSTVTDAAEDSIVLDAALDAGSDTGSPDAGGDSGGPDSASDATIDGGGGPGNVAPISPWNGYATATGAGRVANQPTFRWRPVGGATRYELEVDDSCAPLTFATCAFPSPELVQPVVASFFQPSGVTRLPVSMVAPVGRRYYWRVRACNATDCSAYAATRYVDVGRVREDLNGDGYADVVIGAVNQDSPETDEGNAFVYYGSASGISPTPSVTIDNPRDLSPGRFGTSVAMVGDVNADGFSDLAIGAMGQGSVYLFYGGVSGVALPDVTLDGFGALGASLSGGDLNGDGLSDITVGTSNWGIGASGSGSAYVFSGQDLTGPMQTLGPFLDTSFGTSMTTSADFDGDGYVDLVVGCEAAFRAHQGEYVRAYQGGPSWLDAGRALAEPLGQPDSEFGLAVASGDLDGDGYGDLVVGAALSENPMINEGVVHFYRGSATGLGSIPDATIGDPVSEVAALFGRAIAVVRDIDGDGIDDLVVGAPQQNLGQNDEGNVFVLQSRTGLPPGPAFAQIDNPLGEAFSFFGSAVGSAGDVNGDGLGDVIASCYRASNPQGGEGNAWIFSGSSGGVETTAEATLDNPTGEFNAFFGYAVSN